MPNKEEPLAERPGSEGPDRDIEPDNEPQDNGPKEGQESLEGGVTLEPRILLSATWIDGTAGDDILGGGAGDDAIQGFAGNDDLRGKGGDDILRGGAGDDTLRGEGGIDTADYADATSGVTVDLTSSSAQDTVGAGVDTLSGIEGVTGSGFDDTFTFAAPANGDAYIVDGAGGSNIVDLSGFSSSDVTFGDGTMTIDLGGGDSFQVDYSNVDTISFSDVNATVLTTDVSLTGFTGAGLYIDGDQAFSVDLSGPGDIDWSYDSGSETVSVTYGSSTQWNTTLTIADRNGTDLVIDSISTPVELGNLTTNVGVGSLTTAAGYDIQGNVTIGGDLDSLDVGRNVKFGFILVQGDLGVGTISSDLTTSMTIQGDVGSLDLNGIKTGATLTIDGDVGLLDLSTTVTGPSSVIIGGDVTTLLVGSSVAGTITVAGDLDSGAFGSISGVVSAAQVIGDLDFRVEGVQKGGTYTNPTDFTYDNGVLSSDALPSADAGADQAVARNTPVSLDASGSTDPESQPLTYTWTQISGSTVTLSDVNAVNPTFTSPNVADALVFRVQASDGNGSTTDEVTINVTAPSNDPPNSVAGIDQSVAEGGVVTLDGSGSSDPNGDSLTYTWVQKSGPAVTLSDPKAIQPTFTSPNLVANTDLIFELTVFDGTNTGTDSVTITINATDEAPTANAGVDQIVSETTTVTLNATGSTDPEGRALTYTWVQTSGPAVVLSDPNSAKPTFTAPNLTTSTDVTFELTASDGTTPSVDTVTVTINATDEAPTASAGSDQVVVESSIVTLDATASTDPESQSLTYTWTQTGGPAVTLSDPSAAQPTFTSPDVSSPTRLTFEVDASDGTNATQDTIVVIVNPAGLVANWAFDGSGQTVTDVTGYGNDGTLGSTTGTEASDPTRVVDPVRGPVLNFDGNDFVGDLGPGPSGDFTISAWVRDDGTGTDTWQTVYSSGNDEVWLGKGKVNGNIALDIGGGGYVETGVGTLVSGVWHHVVGTWDGTTAHIYLDGADMALTTTGSLQDPTAGNSALGAFAPNPNSDWWSGSLDDVRVYDLAIDGAEVALIGGSPTADAGTDQSVAENSVVTLDATGSSDPEGEALTYTWVQTSGPAVALSDPNASQPTFTAPDLAANTDLTFQMTASDGTSVDADSVTITINADDDAPTANAGTNQSVGENTLVTLDATGSADPEGQALTYTWVQTSGPAVTLSDPNAAQPTFTTPNLAANTDVSFQLTASDGTTPSIDTVTVTINATDEAPTASAGTNQSVGENTLVTLDATGSTDPEGQTLTYTWVQTSGPSVTLSDPNAAQPTFTAPNLAANTDVSFQLTASDGTTPSIDTVTVTINATDEAPTASAGTNQSVGEATLVTLDATGSTDPEGQTLTYTWVQTSGPAVTLSDPNAAQPTFTAPNLAANTDVSFQLTATDGTTPSIDTVTVTINADDDAPTASAGTNQSVGEATLVTLDATGSTDPEGQALTYTWVQTSGPAVTLSDPNAAQPTFTTPNLAANTDVSFQLTASDGTTPSIDTVTVTINATDEAPTASAGTNQSVGENTLVTLDATGSTDPEGQALTYTWVQTSGPAVTLSDPNAAQPTFTAPNLAANTDVSFQLTASDGTTPSIDTVTVTINATDEAPTASAGTNQSVGEATLVTLDATGSTDPEGQNLTYTWVQTSGPSVTLSDPNAAQPTFTAPNLAANTDVSFQLTASDGTTPSIDTVTVTINATDEAPTANAGTNQSVGEATLVTLDATGSTDPEGQALTYTWVQTSGPSVTLSDPNAAQPTFTAPNLAANTDVSFQLTASDGTTPSIDTVTVTINATDEAPTASAGTNQSVGENTLVTLDATGSTDPEGQALTYTWVQTSGPAVTLSDPNAAQPTFTAPNLAANTDVSFQLTASDGTTPSMDTVTVTINATDEAPTASAGTNQSVGEATLVTLDATGSTDPEGQALTYTWVQTSGPAVTLSDPNASQPTFTAPDLAANTDLTFQMTASDGTSVDADSVTITINADDDAPTASAGTNQSVGENTLVTLDATGSTDPEGQALTYTWVQTSGPAVTLSDPNAAQPTFTTPNLAANTDVSFQLTASDGTTPSIDTVTVTINATDEAPTASAGTNQSVGENTLVTLDATGSTDPEGQALTYTWVQTSGPAVTLSDPNAAQPTFTAPNLAANTDVSFQLTASDGTTPSIDTVTVTINATDEAPTASAGTNQSVGEATLVTLDATGSTDPEGQNLTYTWVQTSGPAVTLSDPNAAQPTFTAPNLAANTDVSFQLTATDGTTPSIDTVTVTINADDDAPTASAGTNQSVGEATLVTLDATGSTDPEGQALTYTWVQTSGPAVTLSDPNAAQPTFTTPNLAANTDVSFQLTASDGTTPSIDTVTVTINATDEAPTASAGTNQSVGENTLVTLDATGSTDPEGQALTYTWVQTSGPAVTLSDPNAAQPTFTAPNLAANTDVSFQLTASDGTTPSIDTVTVTINATDEAPTASAGTNQSVGEATLVTLDATGSTDPEGQTLTYTWVQTSGPAVTLSDPNAAQPTFTAPNLAANTDVSFQLTATDGTTPSIDTVTVTINATDEAPTANAGTNQSVGENTLVTLDATGSTDPEGQALTYTWVQTSGPAVTLSDPNAAQPTFTLDELPFGTALTFELTASDGTTKSIDTVMVTMDVNVAPTVTTSGFMTADEGETVNLSAAAEDPDSSTLTYVWTQIQGPPANLSDPTSPFPQVTIPTGAGGSDLTFQITVSDGVNTTTEVVTISVAEPKIEFRPEPNLPGTGSGPDPAAGPGSEPDPKADLGNATPDTMDDGAVPSPEEAITPGPQSPPTTSEPQPEPATAAAEASEEPRRSTTATASEDDSVEKLMDTLESEAPVIPVVEKRDLVELDSSFLELESAKDVTFRWTQLAGTQVQLSDATAAKPNFEAPELLAGDDLVFEVEIHRNGKVVTETVVVHVSASEVVSRSVIEPMPMETLYAEPGESESEKGEKSPAKSLGKVFAGLFFFLFGKGGKNG